ncbi:MAG TPA: 4-(cytidine 5'-diphospho)-2-C-methyl-D-erythritol kinase [Clostridia bacterium]|nr:4-(cytidine 5'-diphospho)-2-C-methyl-D-erythritol kinase [Clostridia bacterium]
MHEIYIKANAKINWSLDVVGKREDGYHLLDMVLNSVELADEIYIEKSNAIEVSTDSGELPDFQNNIAYRAVKLFSQRYKTSGAKVVIKKRIPIQAGLGGGSADGAAVLEGLYRLYGVEATLEQKREQGLILGADVPFMLTGGLARVGGIGENIKTFQTEYIYNIVIIKPPKGSPTAEIFNNYRKDAIIKRPDNDKLIYALQTGAVRRISEQMINVLQGVTKKFVPETDFLCAELVDAGAQGAVMTGSGSAVFGLFEDMDTAKKTYERFKERFIDVFITKTCTQGLIL